MYLMIYWLEVITSSGRARYMHYNREPNIFPLGPPQLSQLAFYHNDRHFSVVFFSSFSSAFCRTVSLYSAALTPSRTALMQGFFPNVSQYKRERPFKSHDKDQEKKFSISHFFAFVVREAFSQLSVHLQCTLVDLRPHKDVGRFFPFSLPWVFLEGLNGVIDFTANGYGKVWPKYG